MAKEIIMPKLGETMEEGTIVRWMKAEGDRVEKGEPIVEVMTDKATFEVEAPASGFLVKIASPASDAPVPVTRVIGYLGERQDEPAPAPPAAGPASPAVVPASQGAPPPDAGRRPSVPISPRARKLAREKGVDLAGLTGSGPGGRIVEKDVLAAVPPAADEAAAWAAAEEAAVSTDAPAPDAGVRPLAGMRRASAHRLALSKREIPHYYLSADADVTEAAKAKPAGVSLNDVLVKAAALALREFPQLNASFADGGVRQFEEINVCVAMDTAAGLAAPVVSGADNMALAEVAARTKELKEKAKTGRFPPADLTGGTFTVTNLGMLGVDSFTAIINPPQVAILAAGAAKESPAVRDGEVKVRKIMRLTLSADHRAVDGACGARFLARIKEILESQHGKL